MTSNINWYKNKVCLNVLAKDIKNAKDIIKGTNGHVLIGILSKNYNTISEAILDITKWKDELKNNISIGLGSGDPNQSYMVAEISKQINPLHVNQVFTGVGLTIKNYKENKMWINSLVNPSGKPGYVIINTGPLSSKEEKEKAIIPISVAIQMIKDMGGSSIKFFPMRGLKTKDEYIEVVKACAKYNFGLEPTGGIDLNNFQEIMEIAINNGVKKIIPHIYSSIVDADGNTNITKISKLFNIVKVLLKNE